jgi:hypothetical protein
MPRVRTGFLCNYATQEMTGLVSAIGVFADSVAAPALPVNHLFYVVMRLEWEEDELDRHYSIVIEVARDRDGAVVARLAGPGITQRDPTADPTARAVSQMVFPLPVSFPEPGRYTVRVSIDGDVVWEPPVSVSLLDGAPG